MRDVRALHGAIMKLASLSATEFQRVLELLRADAIRTIKALPEAKS